MGKPRIILADLDHEYIKPLLQKFVKEFFDKADLEIISDKEYFDNFFLNPQRIDIFVVSEVLYDPSLKLHDIAHIFVLSENVEAGNTEELDIDRINKYTSTNEIFNEIIGISSKDVDFSGIEKKESKLLVFTSASGGTGKTAVSIGVAESLSKDYKRVLYINASRLQNFMYYFENKVPISSREVLDVLKNPGERVYEDVKALIRHEGLSYLPNFKASLLSLNIPFSIFLNMAISAKKSGDFDFIIVDLENTFDEETIRYLDAADKVIIVLNQSESSVYAANNFVSNVNVHNQDKYFFVCNSYDRNAHNALSSGDYDLKFSINEYVEIFEDGMQNDVEAISNTKGIRKLSVLFE